MHKTVKYIVTNYKKRMHKKALSARFAGTSAYRK